MRCVSVFLTGYGRFTKQDYQQLYNDYEETPVADVLSHLLEQKRFINCRQRKFEKISGASWLRVVR